MNNDEINNQNFTGEIPQNAVSIYGQNDGVDDFPVLKAFQQYIDAEQAKARKRILALGVFFGIVLFAVIVVFMVLLSSINSRNQLLSDRLVDYAMKESERRQPNTAVVQSAETINAMKDAFLSFQTQMAEAAKASGRNESEGRSKEVDESLRKEKALLAAEKERLAIEKERLHQIEIDRQRRKLYPELYERAYDDGYLRDSRTQRSRKRMLSDDDIREIIKEAYPDTPDTPHRKSRQSSNVIEEETKKTDTDSDDEAIEYFKDDAYTIPVDVGGSSNKVKFTLPVE